MENPMSRKTIFKSESSPIPHSLSLQRLDLVPNQAVSTSRTSEDTNMQGIITHDQATQIADKLAENSSSGNNKKKKKGKVQIFYCSDFPPCNLSFTRSEHLARHIRKHTGERPFQCHCNRRFSRLDNLRQHAQSIHQNEEIPEDSLALISSRSQRQIRADKGRPAGNRTRSNTVGSQIGPIREHKRNSWSMSSISSVGSAYSAGYVRERSLPNSQLIPSGEKLGLGLEIPVLDSPTKKQPPSPIGPGTSPLPESILASSESVSWKSSPDTSYLGRVNPKSFQSPNRRLSFPLRLDDSIASSPRENSDLPYSTNPKSFSPVSTHIKSSPAMNMSSIKNILSEKNTKTEENNRRRTWHPDIRPSFNYAVQQSKISSVTTRDPQLQSSNSPCNAPPSMNNLRLPGIESFGPLHRPKTPPPRNFSYSNRETPSQTLWRTQDYYRKQGTEEKEKEHVSNRFTNLLELNHRQRPSSGTNEVLQSPPNVSILSSQMKNYSYKDSSESSNYEYSRPYAKIPPILLPNERYLDNGSNTLGSPIYSQMAELQVHSHSETPIDISHTNNQVLPSFKNSTTEYGWGNFQLKHDREILNLSDLSRYDQFISRPYFSSTTPDRPLTLPYESTF